MAKLKTLYFRSLTTMRRAANRLEKEGEIVNQTNVDCNCGQSWGYYTDTHKLIRCTNCYKSADHLERGE